MLHQINEQSTVTTEPGMTSPPGAPADEDFIHPIGLNSSAMARWITDTRLDTVPQAIYCTSWAVRTVRSHGRIIHSPGHPLHPDRHPR
jgi:hypothetical protein